MHKDKIAEDPDFLSTTAEYIAIEEHIANHERHAAADAAAEAKAAAEAATGTQDTKPTQVKTLRAIQPVLVKDIEEMEAEALPEDLAILDRLDPHAGHRAARGGAAPITSGRVVGCRVLRLRSALCITCAPEEGISVSGATAVNAETGQARHAWRVH